NDLFYPDTREFQWQSGYGAFSVSHSGVDGVERYIRNQKKHHEKMTFREEYLWFLNKYGIEYDERYLWD
ncbi:MAG: transposase, partial [Balneolaceae bacterium]|nr:transposase [Balneolaceae bacterium]MCC5906037.1 transposase [Balneolaceae bacterium]